MHNRNTASLNGTWRYIIDPYETGYYNYRFEPYDQLKGRSNAAFYSNYQAKDKAELVEYNFDTSPGMLIPGDWNSQKLDELYLFIHASTENGSGQLIEWRLGVVPTTVQLPNYD
jgi:beta-glucuronidase